MKPTLVLFLATWLLVALFTKTSPVSAHEFSRLGTVQSLVERGTYQLDDSSFIDTLDKVFRHGHFYSHQPPLLATLEAPVYWALHASGFRFNNRTRGLTVYLFTLLTNGAALALTVVVLSQVFALAAVPRPARDWYALLFTLGTWLLPYGVVSTSHGISALLLAIVAHDLLAIEWRGVTWASCARLGGALGLLSAIEILPLASFVPLSIAFLIASRKMTAATWQGLLAGLALPLVAHAVINVPITGDVIPAGFHSELFDYPGSVFAASSLTGSIKYDSWPALGAYAWQCLVAGRGYFTFAPILGAGLLTGTFAWQFWARARGVQLVLLGGTVASLAGSLLTTNNFGGGAVGFRHAAYLATALLALLLPVVADPRPAGRRRAAALTGLAAVSALVLLLFAVRDPWSPLTVPPSVIGSWDAYVPMVARILRGQLLVP